MGSDFAVIWGQRREARRGETLWIDRKVDDFPKKDVQLSNKENKEIQPLSTANKKGETIMNREQVISIVHEAREAGKTPKLWNADLRDVNLRRVDLAGAELSGADLRGADLVSANLAGARLLNTRLEGADLMHANLRGADLGGARLLDAIMWNADLTDADLWSSTLRGADLRGADLCRANLRDSYLQDANLWGANLSGANMRDTTWRGLRIDGLPSSQLTLTPTPEGWDLRIGSWHGTPDELHELNKFPESTSEENIRHKHYLELAIKLCEAHMEDHADYIKELKEKWGAMR